MLARLTSRDVGSGRSLGTFDEDALVANAPAAPDRAKAMRLMAHMWSGMKLMRKEGKVEWMTCGPDGDYLFKSRNGSRDRANGQGMESGSGRRALISQPRLPPSSWRARCLPTQSRPTARNQPGAPQTALDGPGSTARHSRDVVSVSRQSLTRRHLAARSAVAGSKVAPPTASLDLRLHLQLPLGPAQPCPCGGNLAQPHAEFDFAMDVGCQIHSFPSFPFCRHAPAPCRAAPSSKALWKENCAGIHA